MPGLVDMTPRDEQTQPILSCFPWGGVDLTSQPTAIDSTKGANASNILPNRRFGAFAPIKGRQGIGSALSQYPIQSLNIFPFAQQATQYTTSLLFSTTVGTGTYPNTLALGALPAGGGAYSYISLPASQVGAVGFTGNGGGSWANALNWAFFSTRDPFAQVFKVDGVYEAGTYWQIQPPLLVGPGTVGGSNPNVRLGGAGLITATNVYYTFTYANATQESGAAMGTNPIGPQAWGPVNPTAQTVLMDIAICPDPQCTLINIYRIDDANTQFIFVGSVPNTSGYGGAAAGAARFTDTTADASVAGQTLVERRDTPAPFYDITFYEGRMFGFGHDAYVPYWAQAAGYGTPYAQAAGSSDLWYSNYNEPWGFNSVTQVIQINPNVYGDVAVGVRGVGGVLVCFKTRSSWLLYGDSPDTFQTPIELGSQLGCVSKTSIVSAFGTLYWLSNQGVMYFDGANLENISDDIKAFLDSLSQTDLQAAAGSFHDGMYVLSFPTQNITYIYYPKTKWWFSSTFVSSLYAFSLEDPSLRSSVGGATLPGLGALDAIYGISYVSTYGYVASAQFAFEADDNGGFANAPITSSWTSKVWKPEFASYWKFEFVQIDAAVNLAPGATITVNVITNPGSPSQLTTPAVFTLTGLNNPRQIYYLPETCEGMTVQLQVVVTNALNGSFYILEDVKLFGRMVRKMDQGDNN